MRYSIKARTVDIRENTTINTDTQFGGWMAVNTGAGMAYVMGYPLMPGEGLNFLNAVLPGDVWSEPIRVELRTGATVRMTQLLCKPIGKED